MAGRLPCPEVSTGCLLRFAFPFPENGLFYPDVVVGGLVAGDGIIGGVAAFPSSGAIFTVTANREDACGFGRSGHVVMVCPRNRSEPCTRGGITVPFRKWFKGKKNGWGVQAESLTMQNSKIQFQLIAFWHIFKTVRLIGHLVAAVAVDGVVK